MQSKRIDIIALRMKSVYIAQYYNYEPGNKKPSNVQVKLEKDFISIHFDDGKIVVWKLMDIRSHPLNDQQKVYLTLTKGHEQEHLEVNGQNFLNHLRHQYPHELFLRNQIHSNKSMAVK